MIWSYCSRNVEERTLLTKLNVNTPIIVTDLRESIVGVNHDWVVMCKYTAEEAFGQTPRILQGPMTNVETARDFSMQLRNGGSAFATLLNYKKDGSAFVNFIYGWLLGDLLIAETYAEHAIDHPLPPRESEWLVH